MRHTAYCLNPLSSAIWNLCDGSHAVDQIAGAVTTQLAHPVTVDVVEFALAQFRNDGLLEATPSSAAAVVGLSRRTLMARAGAGAVMMLPMVAAIAAPKAAQAYSGTVDDSPRESTDDFGSSDDSK
jgi:hypothetical protein